MTPIFQGLIPAPYAWTGAELGGKAALARPVDAAALRGLDELAARLSGRPISEITRAEADQPAVNALMADVRAQVMDGRGVAIVIGPDPGRYDPEDYERLYWALGTHLGQGVVQSAFGDHVARVERNPNLPWRGTTTDMELRPHTDFHELMSLACIAKAESGGVSGFVSSLAVHNEIWRTRPELLAPLYEGWFNISLSDRKPSARKTPIFCCIDGKVSCFNNRVFWLRPEEGEPPLPADLVEAMTYMDSVVARPDIRADFMLEPGEMVFWHNFLVMHARTQFQDTAAHHRLLLRLWLNVADGRPMDDEVKARARVIDADHLAGVKASWPRAVRPADAEKV